MEGGDRFLKAQQWLGSLRDFAVVGATVNPEKYGFKYVELYKQNGYNVMPVNPNYQEVLGIECSPSLQHLTTTPQVVISVVPPRVSMNVANQCAELDLKRLWLPPETWNEQILDYCYEHEIEVVHDICPLMALRYFLKARNT